MEQGPTLTSQDLAGRLGVSRMTVGRWLKAGHITPTYITPGGQARWTPADFEQAIVALRGAA